MATKSKVARTKAAEKSSPSSTLRSIKAAPEVAVEARRLHSDDVVIPRSEFESIREQLIKLETEVIGVWACKDDEVDGLERILVPLYAARRNLETAVSLEAEGTVQS